jgi:hypothetical protein
MDNFIEMTDDEWCATYKPIKNHIDTNSSFNGEMFETYGDEVEFIKSYPNPECIWTYGDGDDGGTYIWNGWSFVNRLGYFITEVPCPPNTTIQVQISANYFYCETCNAEIEDPDNLINDKFADLLFCPECATIKDLQQLEKEPHND